MRFDKQFLTQILFMLLGICLFLMPTQTLAQISNWTIMLQAPPGYELYLEQLWEVDIINYEEEPVDVYLFGEVFEASKGDMFRGRSNVITIPAGGIQITAAEITAIKDKWFNSEFKRALDQYGRFPAGEYNLCITVVAAENRQELGASCVQQTVTLPSAPRLITPPDESDVMETYPIFQWTEPTPIPPEAQVSYHYKVCEVYPGQTIQDAINNIAFYQDKNYDMTSIQYPLEGQAFEDGKQYVWQVQALDENGSPIGENEGKSEIWVFTFKPKLMLLSGGLPEPGIVVTTTEDKVFGWRQNKELPCSLREAIHWAIEHVGPDTIVFKLSESDPGYQYRRKVWVFKFNKDLPALKAYDTLIDGHWGQVPSQNFSIPNLIGCQRPTIELDFSGASRGLLIQGNRNTIKGLAIYNSPGPGIRIEGNANVVVCNYIGTNAAQMANLGNLSGVAVRVQGTNNMIGKPKMGNLISGNKNNGVLIYGKATNNSVAGNFIGVKTDGVTKLPNRTGVSIEHGSKANKIGAPTGRSKSKCDKACNIISGNKEYGIRISESDENVVSGCYIGASIEGYATAGNGLDGIQIIGSHNNRIGGGLDNLRNLIIGNRTGIVLTRTKNRKSVINKIEGNYILKNRQRGIYITNGSDNNMVGGSYNQGNVIGDNKNAGICIDNNATRNNIHNNWIGVGKTEVTSKSPNKVTAVAPAIMPNGQGVALYRGAQLNWIGADPARANEIAYNKGDGVHVDGPTTINNGIAGNSIHDNGGKGISLVNGGNGKHPELRIWRTDLINAATNEYYIVGQLDPVFADHPNYRIGIYSDDEDEGEHCEVAVVETPMPTDPLRIGWFGKLAKLRGKRFTYTISDKLGHNTSELLLADVKPAHIGKYPFDMDYFKVDPDNHIPLNPHYHGGWGRWPPTKDIKKFWKPLSWTSSKYIKCCEDAVTESAVSHLRGYWCGYFMTYRQVVMFTGDIYWESFMDEGFVGDWYDSDNNFGLWTAGMAGVHLNSQRYYNPKEADVHKKLECPPDGCDARDWEDFDIAGWIAKNKYYPLLTLEIDRDETFDHWDKHPFWGYFDGYMGHKPGFAEGAFMYNESKFRELTDGKKAIVIGRWVMDGYHYCRSEVHPVFGLAIQDSVPKPGSPGREVWHFMMRRKGGQAVCGGWASQGRSDWYFRFKGRAFTPNAKVSSLLGNNTSSSWVKLQKATGSNDVILKIHLPDEDDRICGTVTIDWK